MYARNHGQREAFWPRRDALFVTWRGHLLTWPASFQRGGSCLEVRSMGLSGLNLLELSFSRFDPLRTTRISAFWLYSTTSIERFSYQWTPSWELPSHCC